ncbi:glycosyltransferase [Spirosoma spitsbergense]|uniref:glycosyltransferase n=1 Tax=Spirosoma spitsbergense TaxID=431554 RepID=UPI00036E225D|nr:glycosyltransferase [Spirosoma spitsbergense]
MKIVFFVHPAFMPSQSMPRFAHMLEKCMCERGHIIEIWSPTARAVKLKVPQGIKKWLGYVDQYILFPNEVRKRIHECALDTLFVFTDHAQGPWVPLIADRPHVIHCHDFLAQQSALGNIPENPTSWSGRQYQAFIRRGYSKGKNFISVSSRTRDQLHALLSSIPACSEVVYNALNQSFPPLDISQSRRQLGSQTGLSLEAGYLLHVGGNQWYKNRVGVIDVYDAWRDHSAVSLPLLMIGASPDAKLMERFQQSPHKANIHLLTDLDNEAVKRAYSGASVFLFPSLAEGFGWPIAEAMASGCPVITTDEAPMTEVAGKAGFLMHRRPVAKAEIRTWAEKATQLVNTVISLSPEARRDVIKVGKENVERFDLACYAETIEAIYQSVLAGHDERKNETILVRA